ncbi:trifunctional serine/threonine-protein kinase/ATP-binding protein/sensor histidine kinase [Dapis sp. BLCC M126]|uniref:trifunctional serine/threonine-protein kinase/ATP-binding protein/sensor histidine kinase n=1 Tax=Dapis sp. BLCC M126 TaxID=3400189 RepID=UPI003CEE0BAE
MTETKTIKIGNYQTIELIHESDRTLVYRAIDIETEQPVIVKLMGNEYPSFNELVQFRNQYAIAKNLDIPGIVKLYSLLRYKNGYALIMEDIGAISLTEYQRQLSVSVAQFWEIALRITEILHHLHQNQIIHKDIKPANILIHPETKEVKLIDFSISSLLPKERTSLQTPNVLEGTLAYISPEQTGRMNRGIDYRSDFYSLGVTFYELLTEKLPFESEDPLEVIYAHMAKTPPSILEAKVPTPLANIVMKLMAKNAEQRYQSALGLKYDLEKCLIEYTETGKIEPFVLGERDRSDRFMIPENLYGREKEVQTLLDAFEGVAEGQIEMMLVAGFSGIGKTAVINEVHKPIVRQRGYFIKGKFDQFNRNIPFSAFVQAFRSLMGQIISESDAELQEWKTKILEAFGSNGQVMIDVIPELEGIIGSQPPVPELSGSAAQNRFNLLMGKFVRVFTTQDHPLVIFLDDLQWADSASLNLLQLLIGDTEAGYLLVLGAYRDNEVFPAHPLMLTLDEIQKQGANFKTLTLEPLTALDINHLVADTLLCELEVARLLSELVYQKTRGNPFFSTQFLRGLHEENCITFDLDVGYWQCDLTQVRQLALTDDVVEFMVGRLRKLSQGTQEVLKLAACIGNLFNLTTLAIICEESQEEVAADLWSALQEGLVLPESETYKFFQGGGLEVEAAIDITVNYRFLHDRVQQAAYLLIREDQKLAVHYHLGSLLLKNLSEEEQQKYIFDIANHLNLSRDLVLQENQTEKLARINLLAGKKAISSTAYGSAIEYLEIGISLLGEDAWSDRYPFMFELYSNLCSAQLCNVQYEQLALTIDHALEKITSPVDRAQIRVFQINKYILQGKYPEGIEVGLVGLRELGIDIDRNNIATLASEEFDAADSALENRPVSSLLDLPTTVKPEIAAIINILAIVEAPIYTLGEIDLYTFVSLKAVNLSIQHGNVSSSIKTYCNYGLLLGALKRKYQRAYEIVEFAIQLSYKLNSKTQRSKAGFIFGFAIWGWIKPIHGAAELNYQSYLEGLESGEKVYAARNLFCGIINQVFEGRNLASFAQNVEKYELISEKLKDNMLSILIAGAKIFTMHLSPLEDMQKQTTELTKASEIIRQGELSQSWITTCAYYMMRIQLGCVTGNFQEGFEYIQKAKIVLKAITGQIISSNYYYYSSLIFINLYSEMSSEAQKEAWEQVCSNQEQLQVWSENCPENFLHKYFLVEAERYRFFGQKVEAIEAYDQAIREAKENGFIQEEALANELASKFYLNWGKEKIACIYMQEAYYCYAQWGAKAKIDDLEKRYPQLLTPILQGQQLGETGNSKITTLTKGTVSTTSHSTGEFLDLATLMKASRSLSQEINLNGAIANLMRVVQENAGAETVALMLFQADTLMLRSHATGKKMSVMNIPVETSNNIPLTLVNHVKNTRRHLVLDHATEDNDYSRDDYIQKHQPQSILCMPLIDRGELIGILYLENNQVRGAFTSDRIEILNLLCSQAAIALQNAQLYQKEQQALTDLQQAQLQLVQSEKMATLGNLVAGVAHEINNPVGFIGGNVDAAQEHLQDLLSILSLYQENTSPPQEIAEEIEELEPDFIAEDFPKLIASMEEGCNIIRNISKSLRTFSRTDTVSKTEFNLHEGIDSTLLILKYRLKANKQRPAIEIVKNYGDIVKVKCYPGQLNQVFMNLLANGIDAIDESNQGKTFQEIQKEPNYITISTELGEDKKSVILRIADNGMGMPEDVKARLFEQGFTTKGVGKGTGLGMAIAHQIVTEKHGGKISCDSTVGQGTIFTLVIPI